MELIENLTINKPDNTTNRHLGRSMAQTQNGYRSSKRRRNNIRIKARDSEAMTVNPEPHFPQTSHMERTKRLVSPSRYSQEQSLKVFSNL